MKKAIIACVIVALGMSCRMDFWNAKDELRPVVIEGQEGTYRSLFSYSWVVVLEEQRAVALPLSDGDFLSAPTEENKSDGCIFPYRHSDGVRLRFSSSSFAAYCNGRLFWLHLRDQPEVKKFVREQPDSTFRNLRSVMIDDSLTDSFLPVVIRIAKLKPDVGVTISTGNPKLEFALSLFRPDWVYLCIDDSLSGETALNLLSQHQNLSSLMLVGDQNVSRLPELPNLRALWLVSGSDSSPIEELSRYPALERLLVAGDRVSDLAWLKPLTHLRVLDLSLCAELRNIDSIVLLRELRSLRLDGSGDLADLRPINSLPNLEQLSLPPGTRPEQFEEIIAHQPRLNALGIKGCDSIADLRPVRKLSDLFALFAFDGIRDYSPLFGAKNLRILAVPSDLFNDSLAAQLNELQSNLPNCTIEPGACLGSGWLLIHFPAMLLLQASIGSLRRKRGNLHQAERQ